MKTIILILLTSVLAQAQDKPSAINRDRVLFPATNISAALLHATNDLSGFTNRIEILTNEYIKPTITNLVKVEDSFFVVTSPLVYKVKVSPEGVTNLVATLANSGEICRQRGHAWTDHYHQALENRPFSQRCRLCTLCRAHQDLVSEWK